MYKETTGENISRQQFLFQLDTELGALYEESCAKDNILNPSPNLCTYLCVRKTCQVRYCKNNKTTTICSKCNNMYVANVHLKPK